MSTLIASGGPLLFSNGPLEIRARKPRYVSLGFNSALGMITQDRQQITNFVATPASRGWYRIATDGKIFVAVATSNSNIAATSPDGITWTERTLPQSAFWFAITYGAGVFVALAENYPWNIAAYSSNGGVTWTQITLPQISNWQSVTYGDGIFVAIGRQDWGVVRSADGINWTSPTIGTGTTNYLPFVNATSVAYGAGMFIVSQGYSGTSANIARSTDQGTTWTLASTLPEGADYWALTYTGINFIVAGNTIAANSLPSNSYTSTDGVTWTQRTMPYANIPWQSLATDGQGNVMAVGRTNTIARSNDHGNTWTGTVVGNLLSYYSLAYGGDQT